VALAASLIASDDLDVAMACLQVYLLYNAPNAALVLLLLRRSQPATLAEQV
jgi:hypothetical protein